jgi:hypothetical protein
LWRWRTRATRVPNVTRAQSSSFFILLTDAEKGIPTPDTTVAPIYRKGA